jgi:cell division FtsZ-interacting protein ZapD
MIKQQQNKTIQKIIITSNPIVREQWIGLSILHASCRIWKVLQLNPFYQFCHLNLDTAARNPTGVP